MNRKPDFIIIGSMKSATTTLQEQLVRQPAIFMCSPKEPNFFSDDNQFAKGLDWYCNLFASAPPDSLLGEASTHYTKLPTYPCTVERLKESVPGAKLIYVMRHPVDRLISHYIHEWSMGVYNCNLEEAIDQYPEMVSYGQYAFQLKPFIEAFGLKSICPVFFDRLIKHPQSELERVCRFIGYTGEPEWVDELPPGNVSRKRIKKFPLYSLLVGSKIATNLRRSMIPKGIRDKIKSRLTMKVRPELNSIKKDRLMVVFDEDLSVLGSWLGVDLNCGNFVETTSEKVLEWSV